MFSLMTARTFALSLSLLAQAVIALQQSWAGEDMMLNLLKATPLFANDPVTLTPEEREPALGWPITKVYLTTQRLILNRTNPQSGRTAAFFYMIRVNDDRWRADFQFWLREISDAYWSDEGPAPYLLDLHRQARVRRSISSWERLEPESGYLLDGVNGPELVLRYTRGAPPFSSTDVSYPLTAVLWISDRLGFVAEVAPPSTAEGRKNP